MLPVGNLLSAERLRASCQALCGTLAEHGLVVGNASWETTQGCAEVHGSSFCLLARAEQVAAQRRVRRGIARRLRRIPNNFKLCPTLHLR